MRTQALRIQNMLAYNILISQAGPTANKALHPPLVHCTGPQHTTRAYRHGVMLTLHGQKGKETTGYASQRGYGRP